MTMNSEPKYEVRSWGLCSGVFYADTKEQVWNIIGKLGFFDGYEVRYVKTGEIVAGFIPL